MSKASKARPKTRTKAAPATKVGMPLVAQIACTGDGDIEPGSTDYLAAKTMRDSLERALNRADANSRPEPHPLAELESLLEGTRAHLCDALCDLAPMYSEVGDLNELAGIFRALNALDVALTIEMPATLKRIGCGLARENEARS